MENCHHNPFPYESFLMGYKSSSVRQGLMPMVKVKGECGALTSTSCCSAVQQEKQSSRELCLQHSYSQGQIQQLPQTTTSQEQSWPCKELRRDSLVRPHPPEVMLTSQPPCKQSNYERKIRAVKQQNRHSLSNLTEAVRRHGFEEVIFKMGSNLHFHCIFPEITHFHSTAPANCLWVSTKIVSEQKY